MMTNVIKNRSIIFKPTTGFVEVIMSKRFFSFASRIKYKKLILSKDKDIFLPQTLEDRRY